jgi:hypothetical protein
MLVGTGSRRASMVITGRGELETAASHQNLLSRRGFQFLPQLIGAADEWNILRRLRIGMTNDPRFAAVAALVVDVAKLLEDQGLQTAFAQRPRGSRAHRPSAEHDDVKVAWFQQLDSLGHVIWRYG